MPRPLKYTKRQVEKAVKESTTWAEVCRKVGVKPMTGSQTHLKNRAVNWGIDYPHFVGQSFNKGRTFPDQRRQIDYYLKLNGPFITSHNLKNKLFREGIKKEECEKCGLFQWRGEELPLHLDHKNGNNKDNRLKNLQILCPNCHGVKTRKDRRK